MSADQIRIGLVGAGANTRARHIPGLLGQEGVDIVSVANRTRESAERAARQFGIPKVYDAWQSLVDAPDTDAVVIGTWPCLHAAVTLAALAAGKHVLCEARMAMNAAEARRMLDAARARSDLVAQLVPSPVALRVDATVRRLLAEGYLGELLAVDVQSRGAEFVNREAPLHWRQSSALSGVNVMSLGIWYEALMRWVGQAERVLAMGRTCVPRRQDPTSGLMTEVRVPDHLDVLARLRGGAQAHFVFSAVTGLAPANEAWLFGADGTLRFADDRLYGGRRGDAQLGEVPVPPSEAGAWRVEEEFIACIRGRETVKRTTFDDGVTYMEFTDAVARSLADGRPVALPP